MRNINIELINKSEYQIIINDKPYIYKFYKELNIFEFMKNIKNSFKILNIDVKTEIDLDKLSEDIRTLFKEELILFFTEMN